MLVLVGDGDDAVVARRLGHGCCQFGVAGVGIGQVAQLGGELAAGEDAAKAGRAVDVVGGVAQPVGVEHHDAVGAGVDDALAYGAQTVNRVLPATVQGAGLIRQNHPRNVRGLCREYQLPHVLLLESGA
jgi:hypothetical protein